MNAAELEQLRKELLSHTSYLDVLALAMALCESSEFTNSRAEWSRVIYEFRQKNNQRVHKLLEGVRFDTRNEENPHSEQIESFFATMRRSGAITGSSPAMDTYQMSPETKEDIIANQLPRLAKYEPLIRELASVINEKLSVTTQ